MSVFHAVVFDFGNMRWEAKLLFIVMAVLFLVAATYLVREYVKSIVRSRRARHRQTRWVSNKSTNEDFFDIVNRLRRDLDPAYLYPGSPLTMDPYRHLWDHDHTAGMTADEAFATVPR